MARNRLKRLSRARCGFDWWYGTHRRDDQREVVRLLYVATRHQVQALAATLELEGLE